MILTIFKEWTNYLAAGIEAAAAILIAIGAIEATLRAIPVLLPSADPGNLHKEAIRIRLGYWLSLALEFELASDILRTAVTPTWNDIGQLGAIVVLRTVINYFLQQEIIRGTEQRGAIIKQEA